MIKYTAPANHEIILFSLQSKTMFRILSFDHHSKVGLNLHNLFMMISSTLIAIHVNNATTGSVKHSFTNTGTCLSCYNPFFKHANTDSDVEICHVSTTYTTLHHTHLNIPQSCKPRNPVNRAQHTAKSENHSSVI